MAKVSIIVPTYNVEKYIQKCLESLIYQTLKDIEIICVDDKSTDSTLSLIKEFQQKDERIKLIENNENVGCSKSRNIGMDLAEGEYIGFVDSDDWVDFDFYQKLYDKAVETNSDVVKALIYNNKKDFKQNKKMLKDKFVFNSGFYSAVYKTTFLKDKNIRFPENVRTSEVPVFILSVILNTGDISCIFDTYYHYLVREDSKVRTFESGKFQSYLNSVEIMVNLINSSNVSKKEYLDILENRIILELFKRCLWAKLNEDILKNYYKTFVEFITPKLNYQYVFNYKKYYKKVFKTEKFISKIFSITKERFDNETYKVLILLGVKIKLKKVKNKVK